jgi:glycerophosphoryl diester phosphodiesterase
LTLILPRLALPRLVGHRGAAAHAPENTLAGLEAAKRLGMTWVEFDVALSADGHPVILHDESLLRTTGLDRLVSELTLEELRGLDAGRWFGAGFRGERLPTLGEYFDRLAALGLGANIEIKPVTGHEAATAVAVVDTVRSAWPPSLPAPLLSSFSITSLEVARDLGPDIARGYLVDELPAGWQATAARLGCVSVHPWHKPLTQAQVRALKATGYTVVAYTVNEARRGKTLLGWGVDCIITDDPPALAGLAVRNH